MEGGRLKGLFMLYGEDLDGLGLYSDLMRWVSCVALGAEGLQRLLSSAATVSCAEIMVTMQKYVLFDLG